MPVVSLSAIRGKDIPSLIESLERQRKELEFILSSLDNDNVLELSGNLINQGVVQAQHVQIGSATTFQEGYDPTGGTIPGDVTSLKDRMTTVEGEVDTLQSVVSSLETTVAAIPGQIAASEIIDSVTSDPVDAVVGQMWLRSDL